MIYGINFNGVSIPATYRRKFARHKKVAGVSYTLQGVAESAAERDQMLLAATNGTRLLHVEIRKAGLFGIYATY